MKVISDTRSERRITIEFSEAELLSISMSYGDVSLERHEILYKHLEKSTHRMRGTRRLSANDQLNLTIQLASLL